jgi:hypothetical protein
MSMNLRAWNKGDDCRIVGEWSCAAKHANAFVSFLETRRTEVAKAMSGWRLRNEEPVMLRWTSGRHSEASSPRFEEEATR